MAEEVEQRPVVLGVDLARPGSDETVFAVLGGLQCGQSGTERSEIARVLYADRVVGLGAVERTVAEVRRRVAEYEKRQDQRRYGAGLAAAMRALMNVRVPLIKYGRRRRRYRRLFAQVNYIKIAVD